MAAPVLAYGHTMRRLGLVVDLSFFLAAYYLSPLPGLEKLKALVTHYPSFLLKLGHGI